MNSQFIRNMAEEVSVMACNHNEMLSIVERIIDLKLDKNMPNTHDDIMELLNKLLLRLGGTV